MLSQIFRWTPEIFDRILTGEFNLIIQTTHTQWELENKDQRRKGNGYGKENGGQLSYTNPMYQFQIKCSIRYTCRRF
jgi:hypothetical protein